MPVQKKLPKKLGRPVTFKGDPESAALSEGERKRVKRRIANRESARRVRQKRQVLMEELHCKVDFVGLCELAVLSGTIVTRVQKHEMLSQLLPLPGHRLP